MDADDRSELDSSCASCLELVFHPMLFNYGKFKKHFYKSCYASEISFMFNSRLLNPDNYLYGNEKSKASV